MNLNYLIISKKFSNFSMIFKIFQSVFAIWQKTRSKWKISKMKSFFIDLLFGPTLNVSMQGYLHLYHLQLGMHGWACGFWGQTLFFYNWNYFHHTKFIKFNNLRSGLVNI